MLLCNRLYQTAYNLLLKIQYRKRKKIELRKQKKKVKQQSKLTKEANDEKAFNFITNIRQFINSLYFSGFLLFIRFI